jgi:hypothetical protein
MMGGTWSMNRRSNSSYILIRKSDERPGCGMEVHINIEHKETVYEDINRFICLSLMSSSGRL